MNRNVSLPLKTISMNKKTTGLLIFILLALAPVSLKAQNYFGTWEGTNEYGFGWVKPERVVLELYKENDSTIYGASHLYYRNDKYEHYTVRGKINLQDETMQVSEVGELSIKLGFLQENRSGVYYLKMACDDTVCTLKGKWKPKRPILFAAASINTNYKKSIQMLPVVKDSLVNKPEPPAVLQRLPDIQSLIEVDDNKNDVIHIKIYDNGEIDKDSVSLYMDDDMLVYKQQISLTPIAVDIPVSKLKDISKLKLIAESLGTIPPCTAVMVITIGKKRYEVNLSSDFRKNAVVEFFLK
jgi:hypothetical protein